MTQLKITNRVTNAWHQLACKKRLLLWLLLGSLSLIPSPTHAQANIQHQIQPGDTWQALAWRYGLNAADLQAAYGHPNQQRQLPIGATLILPPPAFERTGQIKRPFSSPFQTAIEHGLSPWQLALQNGLTHPYRPLLHAPLFVPDKTSTLRELPPHFTQLELSHIPAIPGKAIALRGIMDSQMPIRTLLAERPFDTFQNNHHVVALGATGAFYGPGEPDLAIIVAEAPLWSQPWRFVDDTWTFQQITLTGSAAQIDQASIQQERERLFGLWAERTPQPLWQAPFQTPIESYLNISSLFGARRSYNGGPYRTYHEGVDFSAYGGTPVLATANGRVILAEFLYVRGGAVIIDHGFGIFSGYYHLSALNTAVGETVTAGQVVGAVGTTGLSTGNHLHWDLLVANTWVDASRWQADGLACWVRAGWGEPCP